jgi:hypothetical protein
VGQWAKDHGFRLPPDAPEVLDFYASRSPIFLAAAFDPTAAAERGQNLGDGTPVHITIPTDNPWVPLRILGLGKLEADRVEADVYLLTDIRPTLLPLASGRNGIDLAHSARATESLLADLRSDRGMEWVPATAWLTKVEVDATAGQLHYDLAIDASGRRAPSRVQAGLVGQTSAEVDGGVNGGRLLTTLVLIVAGTALIGLLLTSRPAGRPVAANR